MALTKVINCSCKNEYQDKLYGMNKRLGNVKSDKSDSDTARCTSCGKEVKFKFITIKK